MAHPYGVYAELRQQAPVSFFEPTGQWLIARHADVNALLRDRRLGRSYLHVATHEEFGKEAEPEFQEPFWRVVRAGMLDVEPPVHTRLRRLVSRAFTPRMVESLRPRVRAIAGGLVDAFVEQGGGDLIAEVAEPLPVTVIAEMLGIPDADRPLLRPWSADICGMYELNPAPEAQHTAVRAASEFAGYLKELARERAARPGDDLISALAQIDELTLGRAGRHLRAAAQRGPRGHGERDGQRLVVPVQEPGRARPPARGSRRCCPRRSRS